jgi:hypothetical protein
VDRPGTNVSRMEKIRSLTATGVCTRRFWKAIDASVVYSGYRWG